VMYLTLSVVPHGH